MDGEKSSFKVSMWSSKVHPRDADQLGYKFKPGQRKKKEKNSNLNLNIQEKKKLVVEELFVILAVHECEGVF